MAKKRRLSALQRKYFGGGKRRARTTRVRRARATSSSSFAPRRSKRSSGSGMFRGWVPLSGKEHLMAFGTGAVVPTISGWLEPVQRKYLGMFGTYSDEAALAIASALAHKFGPSGLVKDLSKEVYRAAIFSAGTQSAGLVQGAVGGLFNGTRSTAASDSSLTVTVA